MRNKFKTLGQVFEEPQEMLNWSDVLPAGTGDTVLIPSPGIHKRIVLVYALIQNKASQTAVDIKLFQNDSNSDFFNWSLFSQGSMAEWIATLGREGRMGAGNSVGIWRSASVSLNVNLYYFVED